MGDNDVPPILATDKDDVGLSAMDYFTWGHIDMGIAFFLLFSLINTIPSLVEGRLIYIIPFWWMMVAVLLFAVIWELIENIILWQMGKKFENRKDSFFNALWDVLFVALGGLLMWGLKGILVNLIMDVAGISVFYIVGIIAFIVVLIAFFIGRAMTK